VQFSRHLNSESSTLRRGPVLLNIFSPETSADESEWRKINGEDERSLMNEISSPEMEDYSDKIR